MRLPGLESVKGFIWRGALGGLAGGAAAALFLWLVTESQIRKALAVEEAGGANHGDEMFNRTQQVLGGMLGAVIYGVIVGIVLAIIAAALWRELPGRSAFGRAIRLATAGFTAWVLVPALKYPPNPPGVGDPDTVGRRTFWFVVLLALSLSLAFAVWRLWQHLSGRGWRDAGRFAAVAIAYCAAVAVLYLVLPASPDPVDMPANIVWHFRLDSLAGNALLWVTTATLFGWLGDRAGGRARAGDRPELASPVGPAA